jgi:inositol-1,3,4-trisphosphate 5/6-kinase/inositol-tetrakisphosphate 1-kinase
MDIFFFTGRNREIHTNTLLKLISNITELIHHVLPPIRLQAAPIRMAASRLRIAYAGPPEKWERMSWADFVTYASSHGVDVFPLDFARPLEDQFPISLIVHKMTYFMNGADLSAHPYLQALEAFARAHPEVPIIDALSAVAVTLDREELTRAFSRIEWPADLRVLLPQTAVLAIAHSATIEQTVAGLHFPVLAKSKVAAGRTTGAHTMRFVTDPGLLE